MLLKINYVLVAVLLFSITSTAQQSIVSGNISAFKEPTLIFSYALGDSWKMDTVKVNQGKFSWKANFKAPQKVYLFFPQRMIEFFAESGKIKIVGNADSLDNLKITGSKTQAEAEAFEKSLKDITDQESPLYEKYGKGSKADQIALEKKLD